MIPNIDRIYVLFTPFQKKMRSTGSTSKLNTEPPRAIQRRSDRLLKRKLGERDDVSLAATTTTPVKKARRGGKVGRRTTGKAKYDSSLTRAEVKTAKVLKQSLEQGGSSQVPRYLPGTSVESPGTLST